MSVLLGVTIVVALAAMLAQGTFCIRAIKSLARTHAREKQEWVRREGELLDRIMHMADKTWTPPPEPFVQPDEDEIPYTFHPEAMLNN